MSHIPQKKTNIESMVAVWEDDINSSSWIWMLLGQNHKQFLKKTKKNPLNFKEKYIKCTNRHLVTSK